MKPHLVFALGACILMVSACASSGASSGGGASVSSGARGHRVHAVQRTTAAVAPIDALAALSAPGRPDSATLLQTTTALGPPDVDRRDGIGALLTWRLPTCALVLGFVQDRLASVNIASRLAGGTPPALDACIAEAKARRPAS